MVTSLLAFLDARLAEDETEAADWAGPPSLRARQRREIKAKQMLIAVALEAAAAVDGEWGDCHEADQIAAGMCEDHGGKAAVRNLAPIAAVYSDHPDYRQEWRADR